MDFISRYSSILLWIIIAFVILMIIKKIIRKTIVLIIMIAVLIISGCIPYSTVNAVIDTTKNSYQTVSKKAALWTIKSIENEENKEQTKILYLLNTIPITKSVSVQIAESPLIYLWDG